ncbi:type II toxin-antitoxin system RelE/ParE family toxin [uncultured Algimonas sp.]|uniref:type II toxin-antitoxin system RelE/ParE family toxin n=1 Tax=uncultured Algimonas sp. TaxID=1547920 RepID=UPI00344C5306
MPRLIASSTFQAWIGTMKDRRAAARIDDRILRLQAGNPGDHKSVGGGVSELRIHFGPGYRVYYTRRENGDLVILLAGGTKRTQARDIDKAVAIAALENWQGG